jgi:hypothetical protein
MSFDDYSECEAYAGRNVYNPAYSGWHLGGFLILRYHQPTGFFRLFRRHQMIREYRP